MMLDLTDDETQALISLLKRAIADDPYPLAPRVCALRAVLDRIEPQ